MKFGVNLGILEPVTCGPDNMSRNALWYWESMYKWLSATDFPGFEMTYKPWDFNLGRSGMPFTRASMETFYGSLKGFREHIGELGIPEIAALHITAGDVVADYQTRSLDESRWLEGLLEFSKEAVDSAAELGAEGVVVSPVPDFACLKEMGLFENSSGPERLMEDLTRTVDRMGEIAGQAGIKLAVRNEYWSLLHGDHVDDLLDAADEKILYSPDVASLYISKVDIYEKIRKYKDRLGFVLLNDTFFEDRHDIYRQPLPEYPQTGAQRVYCMVGDGKVDTTGIVKVLKEVGYEGWTICGSHEATNVPKAILNLRWYINYVLKKV